MIGILAVLTGAGVCRAQTYGPYLKIDGGVNLLGENDLLVGPYNGSLSLDSGYRVDGVLGFEYARWLAVEVEGGFAENSINKFTLEYLYAYPNDSSLTQIPILANLVLRYENRTDFMPYIGVGIGGVMTTLKLESLEDNDAVFAWQGKAGVIYKIDEHAWINAEYKLLASDEQDYLLGGIPLRTKQMFNHFLGLSLTWKF